MHYWADLQSVHRFRCYDNIAQNAKCQRVLVLTVCLVFIFTARRNARIASAVLATAIPSVHPSVRHTPVLCQNDGT